MTIARPERLLEKPHEQRPDRLRFVMPWAMRCEFAEDARRRVPHPDDPGLAATRVEVVPFGPWGKDGPPYAVATVDYAPAHPAADGLLAVLTRRIPASRTEAPAR